MFCLLLAFVLLGPCLCLCLLQKHAFLKFVQMLLLFYLELIDDAAVVFPELVKLSHYLLVGSRRLVVGLVQSLETALKLIAGVARVLEPRGQMTFDRFIVTLLETERYMDQRLVLVLFHEA